MYIINLLSYPSFSWLHVLFIQESWNIFMFKSSVVSKDSVENIAKWNFIKTF